MLIEVLMCPCRDSKKCRHFRNDTYLFDLFSSSSSQSALMFDEQHFEHETVERGQVIVLRIAF
jgi:hypothetical protein